MKNSISRRSFLKKSAIAGVAAANSSLFLGLVNAQQGSGGCPTNYHVYQQGSSGPFCDEAAAEEDIQNATDGLATHPAWGSANYTPFDASEYPVPCRECDPPRIENVYTYIQTVLTPDGAWYWTGYMTYDLISCEQAD